MSIALAHRFEIEAAKARAFAKAWKRAAKLNYGLIQEWRAPDAMEKQIAEHMRFVMRSAQEKVDLKAELDALKAKIEALFPAIEHGDEEHRRWLKEKLAEHFGEGK